MKERVSIRIVANPQMPRGSLMLLAHRTEAALYDAVTRYACGELDKIQYEALVKSIAEQAVRQQGQVVIARGLRTNE